jgi:hypothetical protein
MIEKQSKTTRQGHETTEKDPNIYRPPKIGQTKLPRKHSKNLTKSETTEKKPKFLFNSLGFHHPKMTFLFLHIKKKLVKIIEN